MDCDNDLSQSKMSQVKLALGLHEKEYQSFTVIIVKRFKKNRARQK